jgi:hypothetical protein
MSAPSFFPRELNGANVTVKDSNCSSTFDLEATHGPWHEMSNGLLSLEHIQQREGK